MKTGKQKTLAARVLTIDKDVRKQFLKAFLKQCILRHKVAFFQWRYINCPDANKLQLEEAISSLISWMTKNSPKLFGLLPSEIDD